MKVTKAVITAAGRDHTSLSTQQLVDRDGNSKSALQITLEEIVHAGVQDVCLVIPPGQETAVFQSAGKTSANLTFVEQSKPRGYADALLAAKNFVGKTPFLHLVNDHLFLSSVSESCTQQLIKMAEQEESSVSALQPTPESRLHLYGTIGGKPLASRPGLFQIEKVLEKPTPTNAERALSTPGLRLGHYLCFFGMHVFTPRFMTALEECQSREQAMSICPALQQLARDENYLGYVVQGRRFNLGVKYGHFRAQLGFALDGVDRDEMLNQLLDVVVTRH